MLKHITLSRPLVVFDLETTGPNSVHDRIVEISLLKLYPDDEPFHHTGRVNPQMPISPGATAIHGITDADVADAPAFEDIAGNILALLDDSDLCGYNVRRFDLRMLMNEFKRAGIAFDPTHRRIIDPMVIYHQRHKRDLVAAVKLYCDRDHVEAHGAAADVLATLDVLNAQLATHEDLPHSVEGLHDACADTDAVDFEGRFKKVDGKVCFNFGKYSGRSVEEVVELGDGAGFLRWMLDKDFLDDAKAVARFYLGQ